ncbi:alpha/beta fold hydrolase [Corynebacterium halotolerans]|uniref:Hydrolase, alpha/beta fold family protein n=1 Tax=Corynebacterium halotolerans YIM 70093 = DSM 44683 TaxID=1121362 RepID=M1NNC5_9CORY|nr:alpha/beta hydrolase [Corynebacterium halotolerans]AGF72863.1 hydrolase, alpha/beta fold family protein [Corynebacterium halotolerans YIM 70093 = DSM 44683]
MLTKVPVDGGHLDVHSTGSGPGLVLVHGSAVRASDYARLVQNLSTHFTVHTYDRRGRGTALPAADPYSVTGEVDDLAAVLSACSAPHVFGHSYGGYVALRAALTVPVARLAVYDPAVSVNGGFPTTFIEPFATAVAGGDNARAFALLGSGLGTAGVLANLPENLQTRLGAAFLRTPIGREWLKVLPTVVSETRAVRDGDCPAADYSGIDATVLLLAGSRSPAYFSRTCEELVDVIPDARRVAVPRSGHDAPNRGSRRLVKELERFFLM